MENIIICGNYGAGNVGDEAILRALIQKFRKKAQLTVMSADPKHTHEKFGVNAVALIPTGARSLFKRWFTRKGRGAYRKTIQALQSADRFLLGGGTLLTDEPPQSMLIWGVQLSNALKRVPKIEIYANGIGPFHSSWSKKWVKSLLRRVHRVSLRDDRSIAWAATLGLTNVEKVKDPVQEWNWEAEERHSNASRNDTILFVPRYWSKNSEKTLDVFKQFIHYLVNTEGKKVIGVSFDKNNVKDLEWLEAIEAMVHNKDQFEIRNDYRDEVEVVEWVSKASMVIGMRLHSLIFAEITHTPFVGIAYMEKVKALGEEMRKMEWMVDLETLSLDSLKKAYKSAAKASL